MTDAKSVELELRQLTWRDLASDAYKSAELVVESLSENWMPELIASATPEGEPLSITEKTELLQERLDRQDGQYAYFRSMFGRMGPLLDDMEEFTIPVHPVYYSWYPGMETVSVPESEYQTAWQAIADVESRIAFWNLMAPDHFRDASYIAEKPEEERTPQEIDRLQRYRDRQFNNPFHPHIKKLILDRLRKEKARIRRDLAIGLPDELPPPALDPLYDARPKREVALGADEPDAGTPGTKPEIQSPEVEGVISNLASPLTENDRSLLIAMRSLDAMKHNAQAAGTLVQAALYSGDQKRAFDNLKLNKLVDAKEGRGGGYWLTKDGFLIANHLKNAMENDTK